MGGETMGLNTTGTTLAERGATEPAMDSFPSTEAERIAFWEQAALRLDWEPAPGSQSPTQSPPQDRPWHTAHRLVPADVDAGTGPAITWFEGGKLNVAYNCVDRHVAAGRGDKVALYFEGEPGDRRTVTYADLQREVSMAANALLGLGITKGDRVVIYLPVIPKP
jgi:acetyl-CoA synthetase